MSYWEQNTGATDEWYTPAYVFDALGEKYDLDVAAPQNLATIHTPAERFIHADSLSEQWDGFIWMNPPFGRRNALMPWLDKFFDHDNGIALTPDRTSAPWFHAAWKRTDAVLFTKRISFLRPDGSKGSAPAGGTALWAAGDRAVAALHRASRTGLGIVAAPLRDQLSTLLS